MKHSTQDKHYLSEEGDAFFERNIGNPDPMQLRPKKRQILDALTEAGVWPKRILEYGCNYADLLAYYARETPAECVGVEVSAKALAFGKQAYGDSVQLHQGTIADNPVNANANNTGTFDLIIIDDVLCWVSRETLLQSIANIDDMLAEGGTLFLREFYPDRNRANRNHHVEDEEVFCFKPAGPHAAILTATGMYTTLWQRVYFDHDDPWAQPGNASPFEMRWMDSILRKSVRDYYF